MRILEHAGVPIDRMVCVGGGERVDLGSGVFVSRVPEPALVRVVADEDDAVGRGVPRRPRRHVPGARGSGCAASGSTSPTALDPVATEHLLAGAGGHSDRGDGGALLFLFETPDGTVLFQDTSGHWGGVLDGLTPDVAILAAAGRANVDGEPVQGSLADFVAGQAATLGARRVVLGHHDDWLPGFSVPTDMAPIRAAFAGAGARVRAARARLPRGDADLRGDRADARPRGPRRLGGRRHRRAGRAPPTSRSTDGRIVEVGRVDGRARRTIDADGLVVTPGLRRHPHALRRAGHLGPAPHAVVLARRDHRDPRQLRRGLRAGRARPAHVARRADGGRRGHPGLRARRGHPLGVGVVRRVPRRARAHAARGRRRHPRARTRRCAPT